MRLRPATGYGAAGRLRPDMCGRRLKPHTTRLENNDATVSAGVAIEEVPITTRF